RPRWGTPLFRILPIIWTAAQVAATSGALAAYVTNAARKWRDKKTELPEGTWLTLTLTPAKEDDRRGRTRIVMSNIHEKTAGEIRQKLMRYVRQWRLPTAAISTPPVQAAAPVLKIGQQISVRHAFSSAVS